MRIRSSIPARIGIATVAVTIAYVGTRIVGLPAVGGVSPLFFAAVAVSAYFGGMWSGLLATALSGGITAFLFEHPYSQPNLGWDDFIRLMGFLAVALLISSLQHATERAMERLDDARAEAERQREEAVRAREQAVRANLAKDRFLNVLGHELRNPLSPILSVATLRLRDLQRHAGSQDGSSGLTADELREDFELIRRNVEVEARLIDDLLDSRRIHSGKLRLIRGAEDVATLLNEVVEQARPSTESRGVALSLKTVLPSRDEGPPLRPVVDGDATRLRQVFWNLLNNAVKFTKDGRIAVAVRPARRGRQVTIAIADTGSGIAAEPIESIFRPFVQATHHGEAAASREVLGGLGLGLSIVSALVAAHGGSVRARSVVNQGSVFRIRLPARWQLVAPPVAADPAVLASLAEGRPTRILVVDDHADTARLTARLLKRLGHRVEWANSYTAAMDLHARRVSDGAAFDLLVSDVGLGDGNGYDLMRQLRARNPGLRGIAVTGFGTPADRADALDAGFAAALTKPVAIDQLGDKIDALRRGVN